MTQLDQAVAIRKGQQIDEQTLDLFLKKNLKLPDHKIKVLQFPSGYSNLTYLLQFGSEEMVLRRPPQGANIKSGHDMGREYKILDALSRVYGKVPKPYLYSEDVSVIGAPFYVMERKKGIILRGTDLQKNLPSAKIMKFLSGEFITTLAEIHSLDFKEAGLEGLGHPQGYVKRQVEGWTRRYQNAQTQQVQSIEKMYLWLNEQIPLESRTTLIHNDFKYDNMILKEDGSYQVDAVLDWEMATIGDPLMDLGTTLAYWMHESDPDFITENQMNISTASGNFSRSELVEFYTKKTQFDINNILFYYVFGLFKIAVIIQQIFHRYKQGFSTDERFKTLDKLVEMYGVMGLQALKKKRIDYLF